MLSALVHSCIVKADDTIDFEKKSVELKNKVQNHPQVINYFDHKLKDRLDSFVTVPRRNNNEMSDKLWTNAESINHVFKVAVNWKPQSTPELINFFCIKIKSIGCSKKCSALKIRSFKMCTL
jgi:hypothetical protein